MVEHAFHGAEHDVLAEPAFDHLTAVAGYQIRRVVAGIDHFQFAGLGVQDGKQCGDEHRLVIALGQFIVGQTHDLGRTMAVGGHRLDRRLGLDHKQAGRHALARHIRHRQGQVGWVQPEKIVEIAANRLGWKECGVQVDAVATGGKVTG